MRQGAEPPVRGDSVPVRCRIKLARVAMCFEVGGLVGIRVQIERCVDEEFPCWVACQLRDVAGQMHHFVEKLPVVQAAPVGLAMTYPCEGTIRGVVEAIEAGEREAVLRVSSLQPWGIESTDGVSSFRVFASQLRVPCESPK